MDLRTTKDGRAAEERLKNSGSSIITKKNSIETSPDFSTVQVTFLEPP